MNFPIVNILGVHIHQVNFQETLAQIETWIAPSVLPLAPSPLPLAPCRQICTINPEFIIDARRDPHFAAVLKRADLRVPDGIGVLWAARLFGQPLQERVTGSDGIYRICERAAQKGWRVYLLGAAPGVAARAATILQQLYPGLCVVGADSGNPMDGEWPAIQQRLAAAQPDLLFVAFGHPRQDFWIDRHRHELPVKVAIGVGGAFDFVAGVTVRAPRWVQRLGLEWLHRLWREPWRWRRMLKLPQFVGLVLLQFFGERTFSR
ncbi:MAG: WecB/TagA/CpsF family glycosyltransferase [Caldilineaceae bacterium]